MSYYTKNVDGDLTIHVFDCHTNILVVWKQGNTIVFRYRITPTTAARMAGMWRRFFAARPEFAQAFNQYK